jgi:hypothetical protein
MYCNILYIFLAVWRVTSTESMGDIISTWLLVDTILKFRNCFPMLYLTRSNGHLAGSWDTTYRTNTVFRPQTWTFRAQRSISTHQWIWKYRHSLFPKCKLVQAKNGTKVLVPVQVLVPGYDTLVLARAIVPHRFVGRRFPLKSCIIQPLYFVVLVRSRSHLKQSFEQRPTILSNYKYKYYNYNHAIHTSQTSESNSTSHHGVSSTSHLDLFYLL